MHHLPGLVARRNTNWMVPAASPPATGLGGLITVASPPATYLGGLIATASSPATYLGGLISPPTIPGGLINVPASPPTSQEATKSPEGPAPKTATSLPEPPRIKQDPFQYAMQLSHSPPISSVIPAYYSPSSEPAASPWGSPMRLPIMQPQIRQPPITQRPLSGVPTPPSLLPTPLPVMGLPMMQPQIMQPPIMQRPLSGVQTSPSLLPTPLPVQRAAMEQTMVYTVPTSSPRAPANPQMPPDLLPVSKPRKIDFEPGKSAGTDEEEEEGPVLQRKQTKVQRAAPALPPAPSRPAHAAASAPPGAAKPPDAACHGESPPSHVSNSHGRAKTSATAALPIGTVERISLLQSGYNTMSQEAILNSVARDLEMRSGRMIQLKDREQIGQPVPGQPVPRRIRNRDVQREADAMAVTLTNTYPPEAVVPAPTEHGTPRMTLTTWQADKLAEDFLRNRRPERVYWNVCEPPSLSRSQPPGLSPPVFNADIHPAYAAPPPPALNPDIHLAYAAPPMEVEKLQPAAPKGSPGKQALSLKMSDVDDGVWGLGLYDMPAGWGATGIKFWGTPKKELKITGFLQGTAARQSDLSIGDTIIGVDGESVEHLEPKAIVLKIAGIYKTEVLLETRRGVKARIPRDVSADRLRSVSPTKT